MLAQGDGLLAKQSKVAVSVINYTSAFLAVRVLNMSFKSSHILMELLICPILNAVVKEVKSVKRKTNV